MIIKLNPDELNHMIKLIWKDTRKRCKERNVLEYKSSLDFQMRMIKECVAYCETKQGSQYFTPLMKQSITDIVSMYCRVFVDSKEMFPNSFINILINSNYTKDIDKLKNCKKNKGTL